MHAAGVKRSDSDKIAAAVVDLLAEVRRKRGVNYEDLGGLTGLHATSLSLIERHLRKPTFCQSVPDRLRIAGEAVHNRAKCGKPSEQKGLRALLG